MGLATFSGQTCSRVTRLTRIFETRHRRLVNLTDIGVDPQTHMVFFENIETTLNINRLQM